MMDGTEDNALKNDMVAIRSRDVDSDSCFGSFEDARGVPEWCFSDCDS